MISAPGFDGAIFTSWFSPPGPGEATPLLPANDKVRA
jgi:hypothetical protein